MSVKNIGLSVIFYFTAHFLWPTFTKDVSEWMKKPANLISEAMSDCSEVRHSSFTPWAYVFAPRTSIHLLSGHSLFWLLRLCTLICSHGLGSYVISFLYNLSCFPHKPICILFASHLSIFNPHSGLSLFLPFLSFRVFAVILDPQLFKLISHSTSELLNWVTEIQLYL